MSGEAKVPVSGVALTGSTFKHLEKLAAKHRTTVAAIVSDAAEGLGAIQPELPLRGRDYVRVTPAMEERIHELHAAGYGPAQIAEEVGCSRPSVYNHLPRKARK